jgi:RNA polymerase sigma factor (sigma-70 family)
LFRVLRNHLVDALRADQLKNEIGIESLRDSADVRQDPEASYGRAEMSEQLWSSLAPRELECLWLRAEGLQYQEIANVLAVRSGTVAALLARAHKKIRQSLRKSGYASQEGASSLPVPAPKETPNAS